MNVFIVLIPMLLMSAVFIEIRVIEMTLPREVLASEQKPEEPFDLAIRIRSESYTVELNGATLGSFPRRRTAAGTAAAAYVPPAELSSALAQLVAEHPGHKEIRIVAEATTKYQEIVALMDLARAAGLPEAALDGSERGGA